MPTRAYGNDHVFAPSGFAVFPAQNPPIRWMADLGALLHGEPGGLPGIPILSHVAMVGVRESMWRDGTLARVLGRKGRAD